MKAFFRELIGGQKFEIGRELDDEKGPYLREVIVSRADEKIEYEYMREGRHSDKMQSLTSNISATFYDLDGIPIGGEIIARYEKGKWIILV